jgi:hypothetical protein
MADETPSAVIEDKDMSSSGILEDVSKDVTGFYGVLAMSVTPTLIPLRLIPKFVSQATPSHRHTHSRGTLNVPSRSPILNTRTTKN